MKFINDMINVNFLYMLIFMIFIFLLYNYFNLLSNYKSQIKKVLLFIRLLVLFILFILLINPIHNHSKQYQEKYQVNILIDNSHSMKQNIDLFNIKFRKILDSIDNWVSQNKIISNYYIFGKDVKEINNINNLNFNDDETNYSKFIDYFLKSNNTNDIILISDGQNNKGSFNINTKTIKNKIYTIGIGDKYDIENDISIENISYDIIDDSIKIFISINNNFKKNMLDQSIYLSNDKVKNLNISKYNHYINDERLNVSSTLSLNLFSENNYIYIETEQIEYN